MEINDHIKRALELAIQKAGTQELLSQKCDIRRDYFSNYLNGRVKAIEHEKWLKLYPFLEEFLPEEMRESPRVDSLPDDEKILLECYRTFSSQERTAMIKDFVIKSEAKKMRKAV
jgi:hypothetical protein